MASSERYSVRFLPAALNDMTEIAAAFAMMDSKSGARRIKDKMKKAALQAAEFPYSGVAMPEEKLARAGYRMVLAEKYLMFYRIFEEDKTVLFYRVLDGARDYPALLEKLRPKEDQ